MLSEEDGGIFAGILVYVPPHNSVIRHACVVEYLQSSDSDTPTLHFQTGSPLLLLLLCF